MDTRGAAPLLLVAGTGERSAALYVGGTGRPAPLLSFTHTLRSPTSVVAGGSGGGPDNAPHAASVTGGTFFYRDKFVVLTSGAAVAAYTYYIDAGGGGDDEGGSGGAPDDVAALRRRQAAARYSGYERATWWQGAPDGASLTAVTALNSALSPVLLTACSDRSIRCFDAGGGGGGVAQVLALMEAHDRPITGLALPGAVAPSTSADAGTPPPPPAAALDAVASTATDGTVKVWDLRAAVAARTLSGGHVNRVHAIGAAFSPDASLLAVGSEDRTAVVYDLRTGGVLAKLRGATDTVTAVAWTASGTLLASALDGGLRAYDLRAAWAPPPPV